MEKDIEVQSPEMITQQASQPLMSINLNKPPEKEIVSGEQVVQTYEKIFKNLDEDRVKIDEIFTSFVDMVFNDGDATSASKEAIVNLLKLRIDASDKMIRIADLMTRIVLKDRDTIPSYLLANQNNTIKIEAKDKDKKRNLLRSIHNSLENMKKDDSSKPK